MKSNKLKPKQMLYYINKTTGNLNSIRIDSVSGNSFSFMLHGKSYTLNTDAIGSRLFISPDQANSSRRNSNSAPNSEAPPLSDPPPLSRQCTPLKRSTYTGPAYCCPPASVYDAIVNPPLDTKPYARLLDKPDADDWQQRCLEADDPDSW